MNIFALDSDPIKAAVFLCDKHVVKMFLESVQILSTVARIHGKEAPYKSTHLNHPATRWTAAKAENWFWLVAHAEAIGKEYARRYGKVHKSTTHLETLKSMSEELFSGHSQNWIGHDPFAQCMPEEIRSEDAVEAYRNYYIKNKSNIAKWKLGNVPDWFAGK